MSDDDILLMPDSPDELVVCYLDDLADCAEGEPGNMAWNLQMVARRLRSRTRANVTCGSCGRPATPSRVWTCEPCNLTVATGAER